LDIIYKEAWVESTSGTISIQSIFMDAAYSGIWSHHYHLINLNRHTYTMDQKHGSSSTIKGPETGKKEDTVIKHDGTSPGASSESETEEDGQKQDA